MTIEGAEYVDELRYHLITDKGIYLIIHNIETTLNGVILPAFTSSQEAVNHFNFNSHA